MDLTASEVQKELIAIKKMVGTRAWVYAGIKDDPGGKPCHMSINPDGFGSRRYSTHHQKSIHVDSLTWRDGLKELRAKWDEHFDEHRKQTTERMALAIIEHTNRQGECTDAALRIDFEGEDVDRWSADACAEADRMGGKGPFKVKRAPKANAPADGGKGDDEIPF